MDCNPICILARQLFAQHGTHFNVKQDIGLANKDDVAKEYLSLKQIIEGFNRAFKGVYRSKNGFNAFEQANEFMTFLSAIVQGTLWN
ncbi:hypothetical protein [Mahella australiensis]|uniref:hypothetical protein n=1 Tax=Mahella australiensis TaxID=252966 RepID=UPI0005A05E4B|nr:hypothetical protein [Mahella australiensis]